MFKKIKHLFGTAQDISRQSQREPESSAGAEREIERLQLSAVRYEEEGDWQSAGELYLRLESLDPDNVRWPKDLGFVLSEDQAWDESIAVYLRVLERLPGDANAHCNIGRMRLEQYQLTEADKHLQQALELEPQHVQALFYTGMLAQKNNDFGASVEYFQRCLEQEPAFHFALVNLAVSQFSLGNTQAASGALSKCMEILHPGELQLPLAMPPHKFAHDLEQLEFLVAGSQSGLQPVLNDWQKLSEQLDIAGARDTDAWLDAQVVIDENSPAGVQHAAFQPLLRSEESRVTSALNPDLDFTAIEQQFLTGDLAAVAIDSVLSEEALHGLRRFCQQNTFWYNLKPGYLGAYLQDGFYCDLLFQLAAEMKEALPNVLGQHSWRNMWAYSHDRKHGGINIHADTAAVNVNYWLTPNEANLLPDAGGLVVWDKSPPDDWNFHKLNSDEAAIHEFLESSKAQAVHFPFRENRALLFRSDLFHRTDELDFAPGYLNRRLNLTMLYGEREDIQR